MLAEIARFELRHHLRSPVFWIGVAVFSLLTFQFMATDAVEASGAVGRVQRNAPWVVIGFLGAMAVFAVLISTAFVAGAVIRDVEHRTDAVLYSTPMTKLDYLLGRFSGAFAAALVLFVPVLLAAALAPAMPWIEADRVGPFSAEPYLYAFVVMVAPTLFLTSALFFGLATLTRTMKGTYAGVIGFFLLFGVADFALDDVENQKLAALLDPFGSAAFELATRYWTPVEKNTLVPWTDPGILQNRLLWMAVAVAVLVLTWARFDFTVRAERPRESEGDAEAGAGRRSATEVRLPNTTLRGGAGATALQLVRHARIETASVLRSTPFLVALGFVLLLLMAAAALSTDLVGTPTWPVTRHMLTLLRGSLWLATLILLTVYAGEVVWRDREAGMDEVVDSMPARSAVFWGAKLVALIAVLVLVLVAATLTAMGIQAWQGYTRFEPGVYLVGLLVEVGPTFFFVVVLALAAQAVLDDKYLAFGVTGVYLVTLYLLPALEWDHNLYKYGLGPETPYSDVNGWGSFITGRLWFNLYWAFLALVMMVVVHLFWVRGRERAFGKRLALARARLGRASGAAAALGILGFAGTGAWIFYNTNVLNAWVPADVARDRMARYEREYERFEGAPQPRIVAVRSEVDIHPERRAVHLRGTYTLRNKTDVAIDSLHVLTDPDVRRMEVSVPGAARVHDDEELGYAIWRFDDPLPPGAETTLSFEAADSAVGFTNEPSRLHLVGNGTFFSKGAYFPSIGYSRSRELSDPVERGRRGLPEIERMPALEDSAARMRNYISGDSDWVRYETVVSTSAEQVALAPGDLVREWTEDGRRYFHYSMETPILGFWAYLSGDWEVTRDRWQDVEIAVYHHPDHDFNVERMIDAAKKSLAYFSREFGPYPRRELRIVEFPGYAGFAQAFSGTIPFSESVGFVARLDEDDPDAIDYPFYVTAHEVAHQWWGHQVVGGFQQGATVLSETLAQYSALMVMEDEYGPQRMRRFLRYELDRYLSGRSAERVEELPLERVENQGYIHYRKGSLVMYALRDHVGEDALNGALRRFADAVRYQEPPYTTSRELLSYLEEVVPADRAYLLDDLFRTITLYDLKARSASAEPTEDGRWRVEVVVEARKYRADGDGGEEDAPLDDWVDVAVFGEPADPDDPETGVLRLEQRRVGPGESTFELVVDEEPTRVGVDPFHKLIDRNPDDNVVRVRGPGG